MSSMGRIDYSNLLPMFQALTASGKTLLARVPWCDPTWVMKFLDAGAMGIICPMINTRAQAEEFVSYLRYPPLGQRSWGPTRAMFAYPGYSKDQANDSILAFAMIETGEALANVDEIAATPKSRRALCGASRSFHRHQRRAPAARHWTARNPRLLTRSNASLKRPMTTARRPHYTQLRPSMRPRLWDGAMTWLPSPTDSTILAQGFESHRLATCGASPVEMTDASRQGSKGQANLFRRAAPNLGCFVKSSDRLFFIACASSP